jgi:two-component system, cell cycle response regulator CpdR
MALILLVDDDTSMRHFLGTALVRAGHEVEQCENGRAALTHLQEGKHNGYDLLLTDIVMPEMDGIELSQKVSTLYPDMKIMFMTGFSAVMMDRKELRDNLQVMAKPFHLKDLVRNIENVLGETKPNEEQVD